MPETQYDWNTPPPQPTLPPRPVVLEPPDVVRDALAREETRLQDRGIAVSPEVHKRMLDEWTLSYYFRDLPGVYVAYRAAERGVELLGVGLEEVLKVRRIYGDSEESTIIYGDI
jgi:hypothetical protein